MQSRYADVATKVTVYPKEVDRGAFVAATTFRSVHIVAGVFPRHLEGLYSASIQHEFLFS